MNYFFIEKVTPEEIENLLQQIEIELRQEFEYQELNITLEIKIGIGSGEKKFTFEKYLDDDYYQKNKNYDDKIDEILDEVENKLQKEIF